MKTITGAQSELIQAVLAERDVGELTAGILEKDIHVTDALEALFTAELPGVRLIFCGGTSLSKGYLISNNPQPDHFIMWAEGG